MKMTVILFFVLNATSAFSNDGSGFTHHFVTDEKTGLMFILPIGQDLPVRKVRNSKKPKVSVANTPRSVSLHKTIPPQRPCFSSMDPEDKGVCVSESDMKEVLAILLNPPEGEQEGTPR